jgi:hypothetical protein
MTLDELRAEKQGLETRLCNTIEQELTAFCARTGLCIDGVSIRMADVTTHSDNQPHNMLARVIVSVGL